ncbi:uncharacterized protein LOC116851609 [Odontomachus brunneus]|uniref:uncharacterized protein LOC116851609 n=1 Tax=Odontomachus brunneus TaxID=486640 RepID=UPI0013F1AF2F|nr:uncharacterized protein LOC116851609 [Odontomachus brunneus]
MVCYADDTMVLAGGIKWEEGTATANTAVACAVHSIRQLGLRVTPKDRVYDRSAGVPPRSSIMVESTRVEVTPGIKYLGLHLDGQWDFTSHFERLSPKLGRVAAALCSLLPKIGGPYNRVRRLYANTVSSIALYGAPVWAGEAWAKRRIVAILHGAQRLMATRLVKAYRTVSHVAVTVLAETYNRIAELRRRVGDHLVTTRHVQRIRDSARRRALRRWQRSLEAPNTPGIRTIAAIRPCLPEWVGRAHGGVVIPYDTGKERKAQCHHCAASEYSAEHTLQECPA